MNFTSLFLLKHPLCRLYCAEALWTHRTWLLCLPSCNNCSELYSLKEILKSQLQWVCMLYIRRQLHLYLSYRHYKITLYIHCMWCCSLLECHEYFWHLVNKANFVDNFFLVYLSISTCFGPLCAHHQEKQLCLCDTSYLLSCVDDCLVCRSICSCTPDSHPRRITSTKCCMNTVVSPDDGHIVAQNMQRLINILRISMLRINCAPSLYRDARSTKHKKISDKGWHWNMGLKCHIVLLSSTALPCYYQIRLQITISTEQ